MDTDTRGTFVDDLRAAQHAVSFAVVPSRARAADTHWKKWAEFCAELAVDPLLQDVDDPVILFQVFLHRYRTGRIAPQGHPVRARTAEDALRSVGQTFASMGAGDPRYTEQGKMDFRLTRQITYYKKQDPPPDRVKPIPVQVIRYIMHAALVAGAFQGNLATADMIALAFFFLLRPGEYTATPSETTPFTLQDVQMFAGLRRLDLRTATDYELRAATFASLTFTTQKNAVRGEVIGLAKSGNPELCPVLSIARRVIHLRKNHANSDTPLSMYHDGNGWRKVSPADITSALRTTVLALGPSRLGFNASDISARSLRAAGAMALLCAHVDSDTIRLLGRWRSDEMLRYLHLQAEPVMRNFSAMMLQGGQFVLNPNQDVPQV